MRSLGWGLVQKDRCSYKKRKLGHRHAQRKSHVKTQGEDNHLQTTERDLGETNPADTLNLAV